jgi:hypothetical protein
MEITDGGFAFSPMRIVLAYCAGAPHDIVWVSDRSYLQYGSSVRPAKDSPRIIALKRRFRGGGTDRSSAKEKQRGNCA